MIYMGIQSISNMDKTRFFVFKQMLMWKERIYKQTSEDMVRELVTDVLALCEQQRGTIDIVKLTTPQTS